MPPDGVRERLRDAWIDEVQATIVYELIARRESDPRRAAVLRRLAEVETGHRARLEARMRELGLELPTSGACGSPHGGDCRCASPRSIGCSHARRRWSSRSRTEIDERPTGDADTDHLLEEIRDEERQHTDALASLRAGAVPRLEPARGDAGPRSASHASSAASAGTARRAAGSPGRSTGPTTASPPCSGSSPASRGRPGVAPGAHRRALRRDRLGALDGDRRLPRRALDGGGRGANLAREREEVLAHPEEEKEELSLYYQLKGLTEAEADMIVERIAQDPEKLFEAIQPRNWEVRPPCGATRSRLRWPVGSRPRSARSSPCSRSSGSPATRA